MPVSCSKRHRSESTDDTLLHNQNQSSLCVPEHPAVWSDAAVHPVQQSLRRYWCSVQPVPAELQDLSHPELP